MSKVQRLLGDVEGLKVKALPPRPWTLDPWTLDSSFVIAIALLFT
jgi:hypothetical protein